MLPHVNQLPMATKPHDFINMKEDDDGKMFLVREEGEAWNIDTSVFQKYFGKKQPYWYIGYNHQVDLKKDAFLNNLGKAEKRVFDEEMKKIWAQKMHHKEDVWYMVLEGTDLAGQSKVKLYQDEEVFKAARDAEFLVDQEQYWSSKACWFEDLASAKNYVQMTRDEEGVHWNWPTSIPVVWRKGLLTPVDLEEFPGWNICIETMEDWGISKKRE